MITVTENALNFKKKYPISAQEAVCTLMIQRGWLFRDSDLPYPTLKGIRDFAEYCGISYSAVRTTLSRLNSNGRIRSFKDENKTTRYQMTEASMKMGLATADPRSLQQGFTLAIFSFTKEQEAERGSVRETLKYYGFKKLAQNTYIHGCIETESLKQSIRDLGLEKNFFLFHCPSIDDDDLIQRILAVFELEKRNQFLQSFNNDLTTFLTVDNLDRNEIIHRMCYAGPVHWKVCFMDEPPFPSKYLPKEYPLDSIIRSYPAFVAKYAKEFIEHYSELNI